ncbi:hypothetical protein TRFO_01718 [Tritrichomonas foetus]|uniref:Uncharacterized protein n=1 Tax=Tritrichomonas foetus TaxID=1144522 RepID=A0A1J4JQ01_9EUKA|nr:hypothetical protein TRFO_01718 [Tritrichomonas foetus]|eukprot:OHT01123.1 hypothetical protein TRFO_01718 [Tritrichomonas foetus]
MIMLFLIKISSEICKNVHLFNSVGSVFYAKTSNKSKTFCWIWEGGERFFIVTPMRTTGTIIELHGGHRKIPLHQPPNYILFDSNPPFIAIISKSIVYGIVKLDPGAKFFASGINIPITSCRRGISYSTKHKGKWKASGSNSCLLLAPGPQFRFRLTESLSKGKIIKVFTTNFRDPAMLLTDINWSSYFVPPVVFESFGKGPFPDIEYESDGFNEGHIEVEGLAQEIHEITNAAIICLCIAFIAIIMMIISTISCYITWIRQFGVYSRLRNIEL